MKTVTTGTFKTLIEQLKENEKQGNGKITSLVLTNGFFRAVLDEGNDSSYSQALASLTGDETDDIQDKIDFLLSVETKKAVAQQTTEVLTPEPEVTKPTAKRTRSKKTLADKKDV